MAAYQARYDYSGTAPGMLSFRSGDKFTVKNRTNDDWWTVQDDKGEMGLVPVSYLEPLPSVPQQVEVEQHNGGGSGSSTSSRDIFTALYDFAGQDSSQLSFKNGEKLFLLAKSDASWWTMRAPSGITGLVPLNYIDADTAAAATVSPSTATTSTAASALSTAASVATTTPTTNVSSNRANSRPPHPHNEADDEAFSEVLLSIDRAMQKIHDEAVLQGEVYSSQQKAALQQLASHRKSVVESNTVKPTTPMNSTPLPHSHTPTSTPSTSTPSTSTPSTSTPSTSTPSASTPSTSTPSASTPSPSHQLIKSPQSQGRGSSPSRGGLKQQSGTTSGPSPRPKRKAPAPPSNPGAQKSEKDHYNSLPRKSGKHRSSREDLLDYQSQTLDSSHRSRVQTQPQQSMGPHKGKSGPHSHIHQNHTGTVQQQQQQQQQSRSGRRQTASSAASPHQSQRRKSSDYLLNGGTSVSSTFSSVTSTFSTDSSPQSEAGPSKTSLSRSKSADIRPHPSSSSSSSSPRSPHSPRRAAPTATQNSPRKISLPSGLTPKSSPAAQRKHGSMGCLLESSFSSPSLPSEFSASDGADLVEVVRARTHLSYAKSLQAVAGMLEVLKNKVPQCTAMMDGLLSAVQQSHANTSPSTTRKLDSTADMERLREIFFQLQEVRDDSQQRGWAVHDDQNLIMEYLSELLQILCDADPEVSKKAVQEDKYENILTLIGYYDIESRTPIRLLMLQVFGVLCGLDREIISVLLSSILPNELGRDINNHLTEIEKTLYTCTVCTMMFSTGEAVPLTVYDQWSESYVSFLLDTIENPPEEDSHDQLPDAFLNVILSFNQHFTDSETNLVMKALKTKKDPRHFSEKFMFLINRGEDPVSLGEPCSPDSLTKFALDVFASKDTSGMFYTTDFMVLIDIVLRQISDLCPGEENRTHYLELLYRIVNSTDYRAHNHRQKEITVVLNRIAQEEGAESQRDHDIVKKLWIEHSGCFDEITDL